jgi:hypothetical protein
MITLQKVLWIAGAVIALVVTGLLYKQHYDNQRRLEGKLEFLIQDVGRRDSTLMVYMSGLATKLDQQTATATKTIEHWKTTTQMVSIPGHVDSVFKDSAFAALPDSIKVKVLAQLGTQVANSCSDALNTCKIFKDSAFTAFARKDSLANFWHQQYDIKPRRSLGLSCSF